MFVKLSKKKCNGKNIPESSKSLSKSGNQKSAVTSSVEIPFFWIPFMKSIELHWIPGFRSIVAGFMNLLTHFMPLFLFLYPMKASENFGFKMFSEGIERYKWHEMS